MHWATVSMPLPPWLDTLRTCSSTQQQRLLEDTAIQQGRRLHGMKRRRRHTEKKRYRKWFGAFCWEKTDTERGVWVLRRRS